MSKKRVLITGIAGQDGSYLAEFLDIKGYDIYGIALSPKNHESFLHGLNINRPIKIIYGDMRDPEIINKALSISKPDEIYNFASWTHVGDSFSNEEATYSINYDAAINLILSAIKQNPHTKIYQASSSEMFGKATDSSQSEQSPLNPQSPYAKSKVKTFLECQKIRKETGAFIYSGITYNHESPRRPKNFVTRKITHSLARIKMGLQSDIKVGNIDSCRDWGYAGDYIEAMWKMLQQPIPDDFVIATGKSHSVKDFINLTAKALEMDLIWQGEGIFEHAVDKSSGKTIVSIDEELYRPIEPINLIGNPTKANHILNWQARLSLEEIIQMMVESDVDNIKKYG